MTITINLPNNTKVNFPDGTSQDQIQAAIQKQFPAPQKTGGQYSELSVPENQTVGAENFQQASGPTPAERGMQTQQILGSPQSPSFDPSGLEPYEYSGGIVADSKREPDFVKKIEQWSTGAALGALKWGGALLASEAKNLMPKAIQGSGIHVKEMYEQLSKHASDLKAEYKGIGVEGGELLGGLAGMAIPGGLYVKGAQGLKAGAAMLPGASKVAEWVTSQTPAVLQKAGSFAGRTAEGTGLLASIEGAEYDPNNPGYNLEKAGAALSDPTNIVLGAGGALAGKYLQNVKKYDEVRKDLPSAFYMDTKEPGPWLNLSQMFLDAPYALAPGLTARGRQQKLIGEDLTNYINNVSGQAGATHYKDYVRHVATSVQNAVKRQKAGEKQMWEQGGFKELPITGDSVNNASQMSKQALDVLEQSGVPLSKETKSIFSKLVKSEADDPSLVAVGLGTGKKLKVNDIRDVQVELGRLANNYGKPTATANEQQVAGQLREIRDSLFQPITESVPDAARKNLGAAIEYSRRYHEFLDSVPNISKAAENSFSAKKIAFQFLKENNAFDKQALMSKLTQAEQNTAKAGFLAQAMESATSKSTGKLNLMKFSESLKASTSAPEFLGTDTFKAVEGITKVLRNIHEAQKTGFFKQAAMAGMGIGTAASLGAGGAILGGPVGAAIAISYPALMIIAHNPVIKKTLGHFTRKLSPSVQDALFKSVQRQAMKAGLILNSENGEITHKDEEVK